MGTGLKRHYPDFQQAGNKVTPDEIDRYETYTVINPSISSTWFGTVAGTQTQTGRVLVSINKNADYPRNVRIAYVGASGSVVFLSSGTINGLNQFGSAIAESYVGTAAIDGGTIIGTAVFARVNSGTFNMGTGDAGAGTISLGVGTAGTTTVFGLPTKLGGTSDIKRINGSFNGVGTQTSGTFVFGGTPASAGVTATHAFKAPLDVAAGTVIYNVTYKPTYDASMDGAPMASL